MSVIFAFLIAFVGVVFVLFLRAYATARVRFAKEYSEAVEEFFISARPLVSDNETPAEILQVIGLLNATIASRAMAKRLASFPMHNRWGDRLARLNKVKAEFFSLRPELKDSYDALFTHWFIAVTALSPFAGTIARYSVTSDANRQVASARASKANCNDDGPSATAGMLQAH